MSHKVRPALYATSLDNDRRVQTLHSDVMQSYNKRDNSMTATESKVGSLSIETNVKTIDIDDFRMLIAIREKQDGSTYQ